MRIAGMALAAYAIFLAGGQWRPTFAQGLILSLPKDGSWVRFEGTVKQVEARPDAAEGDVSMEWIQHLTVKSVGKEMSAFPPGGKEVPCRWIEIKVTTGKPSESGVDAGEVGERIYKVLVPERRIVGNVADGENVPYSFLDVVKGYRRLGKDTTPIKSGALQIYPVIATLAHYDELQPAAEPESLRLTTGTVKAQRYKAAKRVVESPTTRTTNEGELWRCAPDAVPFGLARWTVKTTVERKDSVQPRSAFKTVSTTTVEMSAHEWRDAGAKSELIVN